MPKRPFDKPDRLDPLDWPIGRLADLQLFQAMPPRGMSGCARNYMRAALEREIARRGLDWNWYRAQTRGNVHQTT